MDDVRTMNATDKTRPQSSASVGAKPKIAMAGRAHEMLVVLRTEEAKDAAIAALEEIDGFNLNVGTGEITKISDQAMIETNADVFLLDVDLDNPAELRRLEDIKRQLPVGRSIIVTSSNPTVAGMRNLIRLGITDFVPQPLQRVDLLPALATAIGNTPDSTHKKPEAARHVVCFLGACGGVGATTLAVESACALASDSASNRHDVCVLDLDIQAGNAALHLDLATKNSVIDVHRAADRLDGSMLRNAMAHHGCGVDVLAAPSQIHPLEDLTPEGVVRLLRTARQEYRDVLVDLPPIWNVWTRAVVRTADAVVLVLEPTVTAIRQAKRLLDALPKEGLDGRAVALVMNRQPVSQNDMTLEDAATLLGREILYTVPDDPAAMKLVNNYGVPLSELVRGQMVAKQIKHTITSILAQAARPNVKSDANPSSAGGFADDVSRASNGDAGAEIIGLGVTAIAGSAHQELRHEVGQPSAPIVLTEVSETLNEPVFRRVM